MGKTNKKSTIKNRLLGSPGAWKEWLRAAIAAWAGWILLRFFVFGFVSVPGSSMENNVLSGDILVNIKYEYGARMPLRIMPSGLFNSLFSTDTMVPQRQLPYWRFPGNAKPELSDLVVLNAPSQYAKPIDRRMSLVKRIVGTPGDIIHIRKGALKVNGTPLEVNGIKRDFVVEMQRGQEPDDEFFKQFDITEGRKDKRRYVFAFSESKKEEVLAHEAVRRVTPYIASIDNDSRIPFGELAEGWSLDDFGPLVIPQKGTTITLNSDNVNFWKYHLIYHERVKLELSSDSVFVDGKYHSEYVFKQNYYFVMGDNRHRSWDSRMWGLVPESHIKGRAGRVVFSMDLSAPWYGVVRWNRIFRKP